LAHDQLFKELCKPDVMRVGWHLAQKDSRNDFVIDPLGHADFASNLEGKRRHVVEQALSVHGGRQQRLGNPRAAQAAL